MHKTELPALLSNLPAALWFCVQMLKLLPALPCCIVHSPRPFSVPGPRRGAQKSHLQSKCGEGERLGCRTWRSSFEWRALLTVMLPASIRTVVWVLRGNNATKLVTTSWAPMPWNSYTNIKCSKVMLRNFKLFRVKSACVALFACTMLQEATTRDKQTRRKTKFVNPICDLAAATRHINKHD